MVQEDGVALKQSSGLRWLVVLMLAIMLALAIAVGALWNPFNVGKRPAVLPPAGTSATPTANPSPTRPAYQFAPNSDTPVDGAQQCPDSGSVIAGKGDDKTVIKVLEGTVDTPVLLLGPNRRVVVAANATMTGPVTMCGDGATILIIGRMTGTVVIRGNGGKIVVQDGGKDNLPPAYSTTNGLVLACTSQGAPNVPNCDNYKPRSIKPN